MSHDPSRKSFLARVLGLAALGVPAPGAVGVAVPSNKADGRAVAFGSRTSSRHLGSA